MSKKVSASTYTNTVVADDLAVVRRHRRYTLELPLLELIKVSEMAAERTTSF